MKSERTRLGCEVMIGKAPSWLCSARLGLLANQASVASSFDHVSDLISKAGGHIHCLFSPQHGYHSEKQANMVESSNGWDSSLGVPVFSLYGEVREPTEEMLRLVEVLVIDLQDVGTRVYTYGTTIGLCLEAAGRVGVKVVVLDRPNPISGKMIEGNILKEDHQSFVGRYPLPMRHGLTPGELARFIVQECGVSCELEVYGLRGWRREDFFPQTRLPWFYPSPNMPSWETALLYPGMVLFEGTNASEGRGTTMPFQIFGAPFIDQRKFARCLKRYEMDGVILRPVSFEPVFDKWMGETCNGFQIHLIDPLKVNAYRLGIVLLITLLETHPEEFRWLPPPYEYEREKLPIDILLGDGEVRRKMEAGTEVGILEEEWQNELIAYRDRSQGCLLYG